MREVPRDEGAGERDPGKFARQLWPAATPTRSIPPADIRPRSCACTCATHAMVKRTYRLPHLLLVLAHSQDCASCGCMSIRHGLESPHLLPAGRAPRGPNMDDHRTTAVVAQGQRGAISIVGNHIRRWLPQRQQTPGLRRPCRLGCVSPPPALSHEESPYHTAYGDTAPGRLLPTHASQLWNREKDFC
jgi:hypothetical protein